MLMRFYSIYTWKVFSYLGTLLLVLTFHTDSSAQNNQASAKKPVILVLGTYHMTGSGEDVTTPKRQKEIEELVARLKNFRPTKIAVEALFDNAKVNESYGQYLDGTYQLSRNETNQIGFRLAKELKHPKVYAIDWRNKFDLLPVAAFAAANKQEGVLQKGMAGFTEAEGQLNRLIKTATVLEIFRLLNDDKMVGAVDHIMLTTLPHIGKDNNYVGTDVLADWYVRNLKIYTNLTRIIGSDDDRILLIIGSGHANLLRRFIEESGEYILEKPGMYLK